MNHTHNDCGHSHNNNNNTSTYLYIIGLILFILAFFIKPFKNILFFLTVLTAGYHVIGSGFKSTYTNTIKHKKFTPNIHLLMGLAAMGAMIIGDFQEAALLIVIFAGAHFLEHYVEGKSKREITNLLNLNPHDARLILADGTTKKVHTHDLKIGDQLQVLMGDQVPTDGVIIEGSGAIDESSITGESIPVTKTVNDTVFGATLNENGTFIMSVTKDPEDTVISKIIQLVNDSQSNISQTATKIKKFEPIYVTTILILFPLFILFGNYVMNWGWNEALYRGMVFLTVTSPCALAASDVPATLSAISNLAKRGLLFKGGSYLSNLAEIDAVAFDKTGTLTKGKPEVTDVHFTSSNHESRYKQLIVSMERQSNHPLAMAIMRHFEDIESIPLEVNNIIGTGLVATYEGIEYTLGKPSAFSHHDNQLTSQYTQEGKTVVYFGTQSEVLAIIAMMDTPQPSAKNLIEYFNNQEIETLMITGDAKLTAQAVANKLNLKTINAEIHPEDKANIITTLKNKFNMVAMVGDGINDAPALSIADIGIAMGDGTDIAIDVADVALMKNDLNQLIYAHKTSLKLKKVVWQNILFSLGVVVFLVILNILGQMNLPLGVIFHEGSTIMVILNGLRLLKQTK